MVSKSVNRKNRQIVVIKMGFSYFFVVLFVGFNVFSGGSDDRGPRIVVLHDLGDQEHRANPGLMGCGWKSSMIEKTGERNEGRR